MAAPAISAHRPRYLLAFLPTINASIVIRKATAPTIGLAIAIFTFKNAKMREWIQINRDNPEDFLKDTEIFKNSIDFVASLVGK